MTDPIQRETPSEAPPPIHNCMKDTGNNRHVGWWTEETIGHRSLLIEVTPHTVLFSCCEGESAEKRINFITDRDKAIEITRALARALGNSGESKA